MDFRRVEHWASEQNLMKERMSDDNVVPYPNAPEKVISKMLRKYIDDQSRDPHVS